MAGERVFFGSADGSWSWESGRGLASILNLTRPQKSGNHPETAFRTRQHSGGGASNRVVPTLPCRPGDP